MIDICFSYGDWWWWYQVSYISERKVFGQGVVQLFTKDCQNKTTYFNFIHTAHVLDSLIPKHLNRLLQSRIQDLEDIRCLLRVDMGPYHL